MICAAVAVSVVALWRLYGSYIVMLYNYRSAVCGRSMVVLWLALVGVAYIRAHYSRRFARDCLRLGSLSLRLPSRDRGALVARLYLSQLIQ